MAEPDTFTIDEFSVRAVFDAARGEQAGNNQPTARPSNTPPPGMRVRWVHVTSTMPNADGYYPAILATYSTVSKTWTSITGSTCWALVAGAGLPVPSTVIFYVGDLVGAYSDGLAVFAVNTGTALGSLNTTIAQTVDVATSCSGGTLSVTTKVHNTTIASGLTTVDNYT